MSVTVLIVRHNFDKFNDTKAIRNYMNITFCCKSKRRLTLIKYKLKWDLESKTVMPNYKSYV